MASTGLASTDLLTDAFGRVRDVVHRVLDGVTPEELVFRVGAESNTLAWLIWHLARVQDDHVAEVAEQEQVWTAGGWFDRLGLPFDPSATGYGHSSADVAAVRVESGELLLGYYDAVHAATVAYLQELTDNDFERVIDESWNPPVTLGVRLVSVVSDDLQHAGQAAFIRGVGQRAAR